jgi:hypothetical protein
MLGPFVNMMVIQLKDGDFGIISSHGPYRQEQQTNKQTNSSSDGSI